MSALQVAVFEKRPRWTPELQRQFAGEDVRIRSFRSFRDILALPRAGWTTVVVLDLEAGPAECLQILDRIFRRPAGVIVLVVGTPQTRTLEWSIRELGAVHFVWDHLSGDEMAAFCRRQASISVSSTGSEPRGTRSQSPAPR